MLEENKDLDSVLTEEEPITPSGTDIVLPTLSLDEESKMLIDKIISETDEQKTQNLTQLFNANQNKKTMVRVDKLSTLLDAITDQALTRFTSRPDEISNKELFDGLKIVQDLIERGQKQVSGTGETPLIQVNQQTNEVNIGGNQSSLNRDSRERVKSAVLSLLDSIVPKSAPTNTDDVIDAEFTEDVDEEGDTDG